MNNKRGNPDVVVVGAGLSGLTAAAYVAKSGRTVTVLEGSGRIGGQARTDNKDGYLFNQGPHALYMGGPVESALTDLGLSVTGSSPPDGQKLVFDGRLYEGLSSTSSLLRTRALSVKDKLEIGRFLTALPKLDPATLSNTTIDGWLDDSITRPRARQSLEAIVRLTSYGNEPGQLSADVAVTQIQAGLAAGVLYLDGGWAQLVELLASLPGVDVRTRTGAPELPGAPAVIVASGGPGAAAKLLGAHFDVGPPATAHCLDLGLNRRPDVDSMIGGDTPLYFSNHSATAKLAPEGRFHVAVAQYLGGDDEPDTEALREFARLAGVNDEDIEVERKLHRMTAVTAIPTAELGGMRGRPGVGDTGHPGVFIAGDWVGPAGYLADACMASAREAALAALSWIEKRPVAK